MYFIYGQCHQFSHEAALCLTNLYNCLWGFMLGEFTSSVQLMEAEVSLYWKTVCRHLQTQAQVRKNTSIMPSYLGLSYYFFDTYTGII